MNSTIQSMFDSLEHGDKVYLPSKYWEFLNKRNLDQLETTGFDNFKQTVARSYFTWVVGRKDEQFRYLVKQMKLSDWLPVLRGSFRYDVSSLLSRSQQVKYSLFAKMLWKFAEQLDSNGLLKIIDEPYEGNPFRVFMDGRLISQDIANSVLEFYSVYEHFKPQHDEPITIGELGAGYGRNAYVFLNVYKKCRYVIIDIPPALHISQQYLSAVFKNKRIFKFRDFSKFTEIENEYNDSEIVFLLPHQAKMLPQKSFDLFLNISSLHEMKMEQIRAYFDLINYLTNGFFYSKQWFVSRNPEDNIIISQEDYPVPENWKELYLRQARVQVSFFESLYMITR